MFLSLLTCYLQIGVILDQETEKEVVHKDLSKEQDYGRNFKCVTLYFSEDCLSTFLYSISTLESYDRQRAHFSLSERDYTILGSLGCALYNINSFQKTFCDSEESFDICPVYT